MRRKNFVKCLKKTVAMALTLTLTVQMAIPAFGVEAQGVNVRESETQETEMLEDLQLEENSAEVVEDMDYVVYIDTTEKEDGTEDDNFVEEEISISQNTISENIVLNESNKEQESIEKAEGILSEEGAELVKDEETIIYTADLTQGEIEELQESEASIIVEENIELFGAGKKSQVDSKKESKKETKGKGQKNTKEASKEEPEWNVNMVNGDVTVPMEGESVKVAVMDSGIELLSGIPVQQINNMVATEQYLPYYMNDMTGHGTAIAGIIHDIAPNAEIYSVRIMDAENKATLSRVVEGIYWCIENDIDIINMSFGTTVKSAVLEKAIQDANEAGILLVSSAGNGDTQGVEYPAAYEEVIAVGAVNTSAKKTEESAVGEEVELVAPGEQILSDSMLGLETVVSGTSMAAPHVTAVAAVLWQKDKTKTSDFIRGLLSQSANDLGNENEYGNGLVDLAYALEQYKNYEARYRKVIEEETTVFLASEKKLTEEMLIEENETTVETFDEVDYVEGRWGKEEHEKIVDGGKKKLENNGISMSKTDIEIFKLGAIYPDQAFPVKYDQANKVWHGGSAVNYVANYLYAMQVAQLTGKTNSSQIAAGQTTEWFNLMKGQVNSKRIMNQGKSQSWDVILAKYDYANIDTVKKPKEKGRLRSLFLYGMASHILADTYAHSAYCRHNGSLIKISDYHQGTENEDSLTVHPDRFTDAKEAMYRVLVACKSQASGTELDFAPIRLNEKRGYCLKKIIQYAKKAKTKYSNEKINETYKKIDC